MFLVLGYPSHIKLVLYIHEFLSVFSEMVVSVFQMKQQRLEEIK